MGLTPNTRYDIRLEADGQSVDLPARTWSEEFPIGNTTYLPGGNTDQTLYIRDGGTEKGWRLVTPEH